MVSQTRMEAPAPTPVLPVRPPAPVDADELAKALLPFGESRMLPRTAYVDQAVLDWERRHLFGDFVCLGLSTDLPNPGDQRAEPAGEGSVLLVRGEDGKLRAFANTCRHRGHELLPCGEQTAQKSIICPYHAWTYALDGTLAAAARYRHLDKSQWGLTELPVTEWHGLIFAGTLPSELAGLEDWIAPYEPERLVTASRIVYDAAANWKVLAENYHECYHCPAIHPELCRVSPPRSGENFASPAGAWIGGWMSLRDGMVTMSFDGASHGVPLRGLSGDQLRTVVYVNVFPNVLLSLHPDYVMTHRLVPLAPDRTRIECSWAFAPDAVAKPDFDPTYAVEFWDLTNVQDWAACESVQRGLASPYAKPGPLSLAEDGVYQFVSAVARAYQGTR
jgi:glycine betaine catabolism A